MHACEVVGYKHPDHLISTYFQDHYRKLVKKFHLEPEHFQELDARLNADEETFARKQLV